MLCIQDSDDDDEVGDDDDDEVGNDDDDGHLFPQLLAPHKKSQLALGLPENCKFHHRL